MTVGVGLTQLADSENTGLVQESWWYLIYCRFCVQM